ncbi:DUF2529 domain-containing protein [Fredinandcohnia quinoae]|uniref:DUF2529 domain-containing protein n=1 Tax=Fredinandcohnia quinoae TaxID=2918902 RepID=A0AAW5E9W9_9BACI|nr:DUF2529 domain-containing protein [Fredinandcohnia sp. SECRCQ15]MCH1626201.1 DUF2529 domain-containing protein [Fredinandcohnia sp. SECRCQ15]
MMKIFTTQLQGQFKKIMEQEELSIEDGARILAQAVISGGKIYVHGISEMSAITAEALHGAEPLAAAKPLFFNGDMAEVTDLDRVLLISRFSTDNEAIMLADSLHKKGIQTVGISAVKKDEDAQSLDNIVDIHIDSKLTKPLLPNEDGTRFGFPSVMTALYAYYGLAFTIKEMIAEFE